MATEFKRLSDVNVIEFMSDSTNVLIEENGEIVKMSGNKMIPPDVALKSDIPTGVIKSVNGVTPDEAGNVVIESGMVITFTYHSDSEATFTADKAFEDVWQELRAGKNVIGLMVSESGDMITGNTLPVAVYASANMSDKPGHRLIAFTAASLLGNRANMITMKFYDDESVAQESMQLAPYVS